MFDILVPKLFATIVTSFQFSQCFEIGVSNICSFAWIKLGNFSQRLCTQLHVTARKLQTWFTSLFFLFIYFQPVLDVDVPFWVWTRNINFGVRLIVIPQNIVGALKSCFYILIFMSIYVFIVTQKQVMADISNSIFGFKCK